MNFKKIVTLTLALLLAFGACLAFVGCGEVTPPECTEHIDENSDGVCDNEGCGAAVEVTPGGNGDTEYFNENGELILFKGGVPTFNFVYGADAKVSVASLLATLATELNELSSGGIKSYAETDKNYVPQDVEIIVGTMETMDDEYCFNKYELGKNGYMVKQVGTKIVVLGGSDDALITAYNYLKNDVFGIMRSTPPFTDFVMADAKNYEKIISNYKLKDVKIGDASIKDFTLVSQSSDKVARGIALNIQNTLYEKAGIWLTSKAGKEPLDDAKSIVIRTIANDGVSDGFEIRYENDDVIIECMYSYLFEKTFNTIYDSILKTTGTAYLRENSTHLRTIYYEDYVSDTTGKANAISGIIQCHIDANAYGHKVKAVRSGTATFLIKETEGRYATIMTDTDWTGATFIIDDSFLTADKYSDDRRAHIFRVASTNTDKWYSADETAEDGTIPKILSNLSKAGGIDKDTFNEELTFDLGLGRDALVYIYNHNHRNYVRYGENADEGAYQQEFIYLKADGTVDESTPLLYDYADVTQIMVSYVDDAPITITGGIFNTIANQLPRSYSYYTYRGILIQRSNTVLQNLEHYIEGEGETGAPYSGFITINGTNNVTVKDTILTGHRAYTVEGNLNNTMGTYDLAPSSCNNTLLLNVKQTNFLIKDANGYDVPSVGNGYWGIMGGNDCKNLTYDGCRLTRYDSHRGTVNSTIIRSEVSHIAVIGGGLMRIEDSKVYMSSASMNYIVGLRADYGATWNGELVIKNVEMVTHGAFSKSDAAIISGSWDNTAYRTHDFGYDCYAPYKVTVDNFTVNSTKVTKVLLVQGGISSPQSGTINTYHTTKEFHIYNNTKGYTYDKVYGSCVMTEH